MLNMRIIGHPANWFNVTAITVFWVVLVYLLAAGFSKSSAKKGASTT